MNTNSRLVFSHWSARHCWALTWPLLHGPVVGTKSPCTTSMEYDLAKYIYTQSHDMNSMKLVIPLHFISRRETPNDAVTPQRQIQFTPKMKANAVPRLLSSLVWIDQYNECNGMTSFMEFIKRLNTLFLCIVLRAGVANYRINYNGSITRRDQLQWVNYHRAFHGSIQISFSQDSYSPNTM